MKNIKDLETALKAFEEAANNHAKATESGDYKTGNRQYTVLIEAVAFLKKQNEMQRLIPFLSHQSVGVRMWAATYLLPIIENEGIRALELIAEETGVHSFTAEMTLSEWRKGNLKL